MRFDKRRKGRGACATWPIANCLLVLPGLVPRSFQVVPPPHRSITHPPLFTQTKPQNPFRTAQLLHGPTTKMGVCQGWKKTQLFRPMHWFFGFPRKNPTIKPWFYTSWRHMYSSRQLGPLVCNLNISAIKPNKIGFC